jgi:hypothetical protein
MLWRKMIGLAALAVASWPTASRACSLVPGFIGPSNFELVQMADAIVVAVAERRTRGEDGFPQIQFRTESVLKGSPPSRFSSEGGFGRIGPSDNEDVSSPHPDASSGACNRQTFTRGGRYLMFLERGSDGRWAEHSMPFSRVNEDYSGETDSWIRSVRRYLDLQRRLSPMEQLAALARMAETGHDNDGRPLRAGERADIRAHLGWISPWKPTPWLVEVYERLERGELLPFAPSPRPDNLEEGYGSGAAELLGQEPQEGSAESAAAEALRAVVEAGSSAPASSAPATDPLRIRILQSLVQGDHPDALPLFERLWAAPETSRAYRGALLRYFARNGHYPRAYSWIETSLLAELRSLARREAQALLWDVAEVQRGESWEEGQERWRSDAHAAATWPALSRIIHRYQIDTFGEDDALPFFDLDQPGS